MKKHRRTGCKVFFCEMFSSCHYLVLDRYVQVWFVWLLLWSSLWLLLWFGLWSVSCYDRVSLELVYGYG